MLFWGAEAGLSGRKWHLDGSKCDLEERKAGFLVENGSYFFE